MLNKIQVGLRGKINVMVVIVGVFCTAVIAVVGTSKSSSAIKKQVSNQMTASSKMMKAKLDDYFKQTQTFTRRLTANRLVEGLFIAFEGAYYGGAFKDNSDNNILSSTYLSNDKLYGARVRNMAADYGMKNILLVSINGQVIMNSTVDKKGDFLGRHLKAGALKGSALSNCYQKALDSNGKKIFFADFQFYKVAQSVNSFLCKKMFAEFDHEDDGIYKGDALGVVIAELDVGKINEIVAEREGMGETGQFYIVGNDHLLRSSLFIESEKFNTKNSISQNISLKTKAVESALEGKNGLNEFVGPNGYEVLTYFDSIEIFGKRWAFIAEKATSEINEPIKSMITFVIFATIGIIIILILISSYLSKLLASPITNSAESLRVISDDVLHNSNEMKIYSGDLSGIADEMSSSIQETMSTLDELTQMVNKNIDNVDRSSQIAEESQNAAKDGLNTVENLMQAFTEINNSNDGVIDAMSDTSKKMMEITEVIKLIADKTTIINDIVFQTKLLSFNASVEAARAGEHGKGFSVVAEEVGNLATASGKAAQEISEMVANSVDQVESIVNSTNKRIQEATDIGKTKVDQGNIVAKQCGSKLDEILQNVTNVNDSINEVRFASGEQATGIREVSKAMQSLDHVAGNATTLSSELLNASTSMGNKSNELEGVVKSLDDLLEGGKKEESASLNEANIKSIDKKVA